MSQQKPQGVIAAVGEVACLIFFVIFIGYMLGWWSISMSRKSTADYKVPNEDEVKEMLIGRQIPVGDSIWFFKPEDKLAVTNIWCVRLGYSNGATMKLSFDVESSKGDNLWLIGNISGVYEEGEDKFDKLIPSHNLEIKKAIE